MPTRNRLSFQDGLTKATELARKDLCGGGDTCASSSPSSFHFSAFSLVALLFLLLLPYLPDIILSPF